MPERDLASILGISRTPLREALKILEYEGLVEYSLTRRLFIANPSLIELADLIKVIGALESLAGELACDRANPEEIDSISSLAEAMSAKSDKIDPLDFFKIDMEFHRQLIASSRNQALIETHRQYNARLWRARFLSSRRIKRRTMTLDQHNQIADSLRKRDSKNISIVLRTHLDTTIKNISEDQEENFFNP